MTIRHHIPIRMVPILLTLEETIQLILKQLPEYDRKDILTMIDEKRQELGPEVVNEESAAMIVARELGIDLQQLSPKSRLRIEDIAETTRNVALIGKVASVGEPRTFARKSGEGEGQEAHHFSETARRKVSCNERFPTSC